MRTTLSIDTPILDEVKRIQKTDGGSLGRTVTRLLAEALAHRGDESQEPSGFEWFSKSMQARVDLADHDAEALKNMRQLVAHPRVRTLSERTDFLATYAEVTSAFPVRANLVPDAHLATILRQHGVTTIYTNDADFKKFDFLQTINPLVG